jgi:hypothetical protein
LAPRPTQLLLVFAALSASCDRPPPTCAAGQCGSQASSKQTFQTWVNRKVDVLFVVDDTPAMAPHAAALAAGLADTAQQLIGASPRSSFHVGFIRAGTCDQSTRGATCNVGASEQFLRSQWCGTVTNVGGPNGFAEAFTCLGDLGASDCGPAQPLAAAVQALASPARPGWEGFLRPDAYLMMVIVAATDDTSGPPGSPTPVSTFVDAVTALKQQSGQVLVSVIGPADCAPDEVQAPRLADFASQFGGTSLYIGLCSGNLPYAVDRIVQFLNIAQSLCVTNVRDTDLDAPGLQASCTFEDRMLAPDGSWTSTSLPSCATSGPPCWELLGAGACGGYQLSVQSGADWCDEAGQQFTIECLSCADPNDPACALPR